MIPPSWGWPSATTTLAYTDLAKSVSDLSVAIVCTAIMALMVLFAFTILARKQWPSLKPTLFTLITLVVVITTATLASTTIALDLQSPMGGPVRWQAKYQIWACDNRINLRDPRGMLNTRIGTASLFERNDDRIHFKGIPMSLPSDISLSSFMLAVGGELSDNTLIVPINDDNAFAGLPPAPEQVQPFIATNRNGSYLALLDGRQCGQATSKVQVFAYQYDAAIKAYRQTKLARPTSYGISPVSDLSQADCIIMEFAPPKNKTDRTCDAGEMR